MSQKPLTTDQRIQVARIAADLMMRHCEELTSSKLRVSLSKQVEIRNELAEREGAPNPVQCQDVLRFEQTFDWLFDTILERVMGESDSF